MTEADRRRAILRKLAGMGDRSTHQVSGIPTGFAALDDALGGGGLPRGRIVEIFGPAGCGKTSLAIQIAGRVQRGGLTAAWIDADHTFDAGWASRLGADTGRMPMAQPESAEQALEIARTLAASAAVDLLVVDSAAALVPGLEMTLGIGSVLGLHSRVMASCLRKLSQTLARSGACAVFLNQARNRVDGKGGSGETSAGGSPLKLYAAVRLKLARSGENRLALRVVKNNAAAGTQGRELEWRRGAGFVESP